MILSPEELLKARQILAQSVLLHVSAQDINSHKEQIEKDAHRFLALGSTIISFCKDDEVCRVYKHKVFGVYNSDKEKSEKLFDAFHDTFKAFINQHTSLNISEWDNDSLLNICLYIVNQHGLQYPMAIADPALNQTHYLPISMTDPRYVQVNYDSVKKVVDIKIWKRLPLVIIDEADRAALEAECLDDPYGSMINSQTKYWVRVGYCFNLSDLVGMPFCSAVDVAIDTQVGFEVHQPGGWVESQEATALFYTKLTENQSLLTDLYAAAILDALKMLSSASIDPSRGPSCMKRLNDMLSYVIGEQKLAKAIARWSLTGEKTIIQTLFSENIERLLTFCLQADALQLNTFFIYWSRVLLALPADIFSAVLHFLQAQIPWVKLGLLYQQGEPNRYCHPDRQAPKAFMTLIEKFNERISLSRVDALLSPVDPQIKEVIKNALALKKIEKMIDELMGIQLMAECLVKKVVAKEVGIPERDVAESSAASSSGRQLEASRASSSAVQRTEADGRAPAPGVAGSMRAAVQAAAAGFWSDGEASASGVGLSDEDKTAAIASQRSP